MSSRRSNSKTRFLSCLVPLLISSVFAQGVSPAMSSQAASKKGAGCRPGTAPEFVDVTAASGIHFRHTYDPEKRYIVESMGGGVLLLDYDRDGWQDIYFSNSPTVAMALDHKDAPGALYRNNHDGTFTDVTAKAGLSATCFGMGGAVGDYNNDGWPDMYLTCLGGNVLYRNNGDGSFTDVTDKAGVRDGRWSTGAAFGDFDGDGKVDLMVANYVDFKLNDLPRFGSESYCKYRGLNVQCGPRGLAGGSDALFHNNGDGTFTDVSKAAGVDDPQGYYGLGVLWSDLNNTGRPDLYMANDSTPKFLYRNLGGGKFREIGLESGTSLSADGAEQASMGLAVGDYNHSGRQSLYVTNFSDENDDLYRNDGNWNFTESSYLSGLAAQSLSLVKWGTAFADFDNDGWLDLVVVAGHVYPQVDELPTGPRYREPALLEMNLRDGRFCDASDQAGESLHVARVSRGLAVGDLFNRGLEDIVIETLDGSPVILKNNGNSARRWISLDLVGTASNRMALNARVSVTAAGMTQTAEVHSGGSYLSQNDTRLHFGLASATVAASVDIHWPSGLVEKLSNLAANHFYTIVEGKGVTAPELAYPKNGKHPL